MNLHGLKQSRKRMVQAIRAAEDRDVAPRGLYRAKRRVTEQIRALKNSKSKDKRVFRKKKQRGA